MDNNVFAQRLKEFRKRVGLTQTDLSNLVNVSLLTVFRWEKGIREPRIEEIKKLAEALHITEAELLNEQQPDRVQITLSWDWEEMKEGEIDMEKNKFKLILGENGELGVIGSGMVPTREKLEQFFLDLREQLEIAFDTQVKRGIIPEA